MRPPCRAHTATTDIFDLRAGRWRPGPPLRSARRCGREIRQRGRKEMGGGQGACVASEARLPLPLPSPLSVPSSCGLSHPRLPLPQLQPPPLPSSELSLVALDFTRPAAHGSCIGSAVLGGRCAHSRPFLATPLPPPPPPLPSGSAHARRIRRARDACRHCLSRHSPRGPAPRCPPPPHTHTQGACPAAPAARAKPSRRAPSARQRPAVPEAPRPVGLAARALRPPATTAKWSQAHRHTPHTPSICRDTARK